MITKQNKKNQKKWCRSRLYCSFMATAAPYNSGNCLFGEECAIQLRSLTVAAGVVTNFTRLHALSCHSLRAISKKLVPTWLRHSTHCQKTPKHHYVTFVLLCATDPSQPTVCLLIWGSRLLHPQFLLEPKVAGKCDFYAGLYNLLGE